MHAARGWNEREVEFGDYMKFNTVERASLGTCIFRDLHVVVFPYAYSISLLDRSIRCETMDIIQETLYDTQFLSQSKMMVLRNY